MIEIYLLEQLLALEECGTLVAASEKVHLTQPSLTRSMQRLEEQAGFPLFTRRKKKIALNENGRLVAKYARRILSEEEEMTRELSLLEKSRHTISLASAGPGPVMEIVPLLASLYPEKTISASLADETSLKKGLFSGEFQLAVFNTKTVADDDSLFCSPCGSERLYYCFDKTFYPTNEDGVYFDEIDGKTVMMPEEIGFWENLVKKEMPHSNFISLKDNQTLNEVTKSSSLPSFATDLGLRLVGSRPERTAVPILDDEAEVKYWCACKKENKEKFSALFQKLAERYEK